MDQLDARDTLFRSCNFSGASLRGSWLAFGEIMECEFIDADLRGAEFIRALLRYNDFTGAKFNDAKFGETDLINNKFVRAVGLVAAKHDAPSMTDLATLAQTLPVRFLRGVGLSDAAIEARSVLTEYKDQFRSCFISYSVSDTTFAERLHEDLQQHGVRCWFAPHTCQLGLRR